MINKNCDVASLANHNKRSLKRCKIQNEENSGYWPAVRKLYSIQGLYMDTRVYTSGEPPVSHPATPNDVTPASVHFPFFIQDRGPPESPYKSVNIYFILKIYIYMYKQYAELLNSENETFSH